MLATPELLRTLDSLVRDDLECVRDFYFGFLQKSTFTVIIGCCLEIPEVIHEIWPHLVPSRDSRKAKIVATVGLFLVISGIAGEFLFERFVSQADDILKQFDEVLIADTERESAFAQRQAAFAYRDAAEANDRAKQAAILAENEKIERLRLEDSIHPRSFNTSERREIAEEVRKFAPSFAGRKIKIQSQVGDSEAFLFAIELGNILDQAGIASDSFGVGRILTTGGLQMGVNVTGPSRDSQFIKALVDGINARIKSRVHGEWKPSYTETEIFVGVKPITNFTLSADGLPSERRSQ